jgi:hypothetical protein
VFPSVADKTSFRFPFQKFFSEPLLHQIFCEFKFISFCASPHHPIPIFSLLTARSQPSLSYSHSNLMRSISCQFVPTTGAIIPYLYPPPATRPRRRATCLPHMPCTSRPPTVCYLAKDTPLITPSMCSTAKVPAGYHSLLHFTRQFRSSPFFNLNNEASLPLSFGGCARHAQTPLNLSVVELLSVLPSNAIHYNHSRAIRHFLYIEHPFIPLRL